MMFISHNLAVVKHIADEMLVMYLGQAVEITARDALYAQPLHPYTRALLSAVPIPEPGARRERQVLEGDVPSPLDPPPGCSFHPRCPIAAAVCSEQEPELRARSGDAGHLASCHLRTGDYRHLAPENRAPAEV